ncbi:MAG: L-threonylcarbamoyladenylate synthase [Rubrobacter sp.]|nr:L-threonylcarbamoyladenylate synthase [Rubrobacter sp.]
MKLVSEHEAADALRRGEVVVAPTDTVVGLFASKVGVPELSRLKLRGPEKPVALLCASAEEAFALTSGVPEVARKLADLYWPGPLTLVLDDRAGGTVGVRVPAHPVSRSLLAAYGGPLYATSANFSGEPAPGTLDDLDPRLAASIRFAVDGEGGGGEASAVVDLSGGRVTLLRPTRELTGERLAGLARPSDTTG